MAKGLLLVISGPSGVGKGTVCKRLVEIRKDLTLSISTTTRPPRDNEEEGREYNFTELPRFKEMIREGAFLEWARVHNHYYGTLLKTVNEVTSRGDDLILEIDVQGAAQVRKKMPGAVLVFLAPPSMEALESRIKGRGTEDAARIRQRLLAASEEIKAYNLYDYLVINDTVENAVGLVSSILDVEKCRVNRGLKPPGLEVNNDDLSFN